MLVLIAGVTGNLGLKLVDALHAHGHQVRGLARNQSKIDAAHMEKLHSFVEIKTYYDIEAIDRGCSGVDAVICAYEGIAELHLDGQLILLRAAERAGVQRFVAASWSCDSRNINLGVHQSYDPGLCFRQQAQLSSKIKPIYIFTGALAEVFFSVPGHGTFSPAHNGVWDPENKSMDVWGTGDEKWDMTTERDAAEFAAVLLGREDATEGGFFTLCSFQYSPKEIAKIYEEVRGTKVAKKMKGSLEELRQKALTARSQGPYGEYFSYIGLFYQLYQLDGTIALGDLDNERIGVKTTGLKEFLQANPAL
ncbi:hypothetical protein ACHAQA_000478 [Verticillium albo-atrum]